MSEETRKALDELRQDIERNPSPEGRATTFVERVTRMYREATVTSDIAQVKAITEELRRKSVQLGQAIADPQPQAGHASGA